MKLPERHPSSRRRLVSALVLLAVALVFLTTRASQTQTPPPAVAAAPGPPAQALPGSCSATACHAALTKQATVHLPAADDCLTCHTQSGTAHGFALMAPPNELCGVCHEVKTESDTFVHGPVAAGDCLTCHDPHASEHRKLVRAPGAGLCQMCHVDMEQMLGERRFAHAPVKDDCTNCHSPHASPYRHQLLREGSDLCTACHEDVKEVSERSQTRHEAVTIDRQCLNCHGPHAENLERLLTAPTRTLCLTCHDRELDAPGGPILDMAEWIANNPNRHGPVEQEDCAACHRPHGSEHFRLLEKDYPPRFYSPFDLKNYELCFSCHPPDLVQVERTTSLTGFRQGDRNLHFLHVNRAEKGRTCRACHEVHASRQPKHIRESVPFGTWTLPINFESMENGGRCAPGCHAAQEYRRSAGSQAP